MSYPSIVGIASEQGINLGSASNEQLAGLLWKSFQADLPLGVNHLTELAEKVKSGFDEKENRVLDIQDPNSALGKQLIRLVGTDIACSVCEQKLGVSFGMYNCCGVVVAPTKEQLNMTLLEQIKLQNGVLASADC